MYIKAYHIKLFGNISCRRAFSGTGQALNNNQPAHIRLLNLWETEKPVMLGKWREFAKNKRSDESYVFNCVLLQNPMCETMIRFNLNWEQSRAGQALNNNQPAHIRLLNFKKNFPHLCQRQNVTLESCESFARFTFCAKF